MKKALIVFVTAVALSCSSSEKKESIQDAISTAQDFINNPETLEEVKDPINSFIADATEKADKVASLSKGNIVELLETAKDYKKCVIVTADHTIVLIENLGDCRQSGSWEHACRRQRVI